MDDEKRRRRNDLLGEKADAEAEIANIEKELRNYGQVFQKLGSALSSNPERCTFDGAGYPSLSDILEPLNALRAAHGVVSNATQALSNL